MGEPATVGRIVHAVLDGRCCAAIVTIESDDPADVATLRVFAPRDVTQPANDDEVYTRATFKNAPDGTWHWPREH